MTSTISNTSTSTNVILPSALRFVVESTLTGASVPVIAPAIPVKDKPGRFWYQGNIDIPLVSDDNRAALEAIVIKLEQGDEHVELAAGEITLSAVKRSRAGDEYGGGNTTRPYSAGVKLGDGKGIAYRSKANATILMVPALDENGAEVEDNDGNTVEVPVITVFVSASRQGGGKKKRAPRSRASVGF